MPTIIPYNLDWRSGINDPTTLKANKQAAWGDPGAVLVQNFNVMANRQVSKVEIPVSQKTVEEMPEIYL